MSDEFGNVPPQAGAPEVEKPWGTPVETGYQQVPPPPPPGGYAVPPQGYAIAPAGSGLSDSAAGAIAYITIIPAIVFLLIDPYKDKPFVKFHCFQCLGLAVIGFILHFLVVIPLLGLLLVLLGDLALFVVWCLCILKASQGGSFKIPVIGRFAAEQSGYNV
ncbi:DUF4870 domain-containing protein [Granulicella paludicola]|uniref:DUF4870 domain-containing protein n=1 Tax=Granulicella paludicola TaxID=474951 RepID=UPI0021DFDB98|nr:hypothetical protein [Granulicella paludicola]